MAPKKASKKNLFIGIGIIAAAFTIAYLLWSFLYGEITMGPQKRDLVNAFLAIPWIPAVALYVVYYLLEQKRQSKVIQGDTKLRWPFLVISGVLVLALIFVPMVVCALVAAAPFFSTMAALLLCALAICYIVLKP
jgi:hypothetical protein